MTHDPLCPFAKWDDVDCYQHDAGVRICDLIAKVREDMIAECIAAVDDRIRPTLHPLENAGIGEALAALRDLQEKP